MYENIPVDILKIILKFCDEHTPFGELDTEKNCYYKNIKDDEDNFEEALKESLQKQSWVINENNELGKNTSEFNFFSLEYITKVYFSESGENDELPWYIVGKIGKYYFFIEARCDYTGWDCQSWGNIIWASRWCNLCKYGLTDKVRLLMNIKIA